MNNREKKLLLIFVVALAAGVLITGTKSYLTYLDNLRSELRAAEQDRKNYEDDDLYSDILERTVDDYQAMSLSSNQNHALASYKAWLIDLLEAELGLTDVRITNEPSRPVEDQYYRHTFGINFQSNLETLTDFLYRFETKKLLHRIKDLAISPSGYDELLVRVTIEAISLPEAEDEVDVAAIEHDPARVQASRDSYWASISNRNLFGLENKKPTFTAPPIDAIVGESTTRTLTASAGANEQSLQEVTYRLDEDSLPANFTASLAGNRLTVSSDKVGRYEFDIKVTDNGLPAKTITSTVAVTVSEKPIPPEPMPEPPKPPVFNVAQLAFFTSTVQINERIEVWIHRRDLGQMLKLPIGAKIEIGTVKGKIHDANQRYVTILTDENEILEVKAGKSLSTAVNITEQAESLLIP